MERMSEPELITVEVPDIGDFEDVPVIEILVSPGDVVGVDDPLLTLESDKATMDVPSPFAGEVRSLQVKVGDRVSQGAVLLTISADGQGAVGSKAAVIASEGVPSEASSPDAIASALEAEPPPAAPAAAPVEDSPGPVYASPVARRMARERGIDLASVRGSGRRGRITTKDLDASGPAGQTSGTVSQPSGGPGPARGSSELGLAPWPSVNFERFGPVERVPRSRIQRIAAPNLARNWVMIPHVTHHDEADVTDLEAWRAQLNTEQEVKVTMVSFLVLASVTALRTFPEFNSSLDGDELVIKRYFNIGFAADTPSGLVVPVIRDADRLGLLEVAERLAVLSGKAREGRLGPEDITGGTFSISSLGGIGGTGFTPIINAPEVAILGATRAALRPVWEGEAFVPRLMLPLSLSYDHRVIDGAAAARFMAFLVRVLGDLRRTLL